MILGDNVFSGSEVFTQAFQEFNSGATVFGYHVHDPERYGVVEFNAAGRLSPSKKNPNPRAVATLSPDSNLRQSHRPNREGPKAKSTWRAGNHRRQHSLPQRRSTASRPPPRGVAWLDAGTTHSLHEASAYVQAIEKRQGTKIGLPEEASYCSGFIDLAQLQTIASRMPTCEYKEYLQAVIEEATRLTANC